MSERLTAINGLNARHYLCCDDEDAQFCNKEECAASMPCSVEQTAIDELAAYEDIGTVEEFGELKAGAEEYHQEMTCMIECRDIDIRALKEKNAAYKQADEEGRMIILPTHCVSWCGVKTGFMFSCAECDKSQGVDYDTK